jgi:HAD superfamily hydrolase (TIGR01549 family)
MKVVFFDLGFTLWNEERAWADWASWLGVSALDFFSALGSVIERGEHHHRMFELLRPGIDLRREQELRKRTGRDDGLRIEDLYPDAIPCLQELRVAGYRTGTAGNHPRKFADTLRRSGAPLDFIGSSEEWGVEKPSPEFFARLVELAGCAARDVVYVGDRVDNDVQPVKAAGITSVFLRRGPWGIIQGRWKEAAEADFKIESLMELRAALERLG